jgi:hypothetical protein
MGREAEDLSSALLNFAGSAPQYLAAAFIVVRTQTQPGDKVRRSGKAR